MNNAPQLPIHQKPRLLRLLRWVLGELGPAGAPQRPDAQRTGRQLGRDGVLAIDTSPSMLERDWLPTRLAAAQAAAHAYLQRLVRHEPSARVAVIGFNGSAHVACALTSVRNHGRITRAIDRLISADGTNLEACVVAAARVLAGSQAGFRQVVLLTDGQSNAGGSPLHIAARLREQATIESIGIGGAPTDVNEDLLKSICSRHADSSPRYRWIGDKAQLIDCFERLAGRITRV